MTGAFAVLPDEPSAVLRTLLVDKDPALAATLAGTAVPTRDDRSRVERVLADELMTQIHGPDWVPTAYGYRLEATIDAFLRRFPIEPTS